MPVYKCDLTFKQSVLAGASWTETYWDVSNVVQLSTALNHATELAMLRVRMLAPNIDLTSIRASDVAIDGDSIINAIGPAPANAAYNPAFNTDTPDFVWTELKVRCEAGTRHRSIRGFSGLPDGVTFSTVRAPTHVQWIVAWTAFEHEMLSGRWGIYALDLEQGSNPQAAITAVGSAGATVTITAAISPGTIGQLIHVRGLKYVTVPGGIVFKINGKFPIVGAPGGNQYNIIPRPGDTSAIVWLGTGKARLVKYAGVAFTALKFRGFSNRKPSGKPIGQLGLRSPKK